MLPPFVGHEVNTRLPSSTTHFSPTSPVNKNRIDYNTKQRKMGNSNSHLPDISVNLGYPPHRDRRQSLSSSTSSYFAIKDKVLEPRRLFQHSLKYRQRWRWCKLLLISAGLLLLLLFFGYIPFFNFESNDYSVDTSRRSPLVAAPLDAERTQLILYRIIGNDLPPRHKEGQTLSNLHFILEHEPDFPDTRKIFLLNRISDPQVEKAIIRLLDAYHMEYIRVPFVLEEYQQLDFRLEDFPEPDFLHSDDYRRFSKVSKLRALDYTYHDKNLYAMNNNGGRNKAIEHGRSIRNAKWIMPFDGNCFLSRNGFHEIKAQLDRYGDETKYFVVPMTRLLNNSVLLNNLDERPKTPEEPQIIFRYDATEEYNLNMRYGRRSKLELLWRLGALENRRLNRPTVPWEPVERSYSPDKGNFRTIGWVFRLFSGNPQQEESKKEASSIRAFNRLLAIQSSLDSLDESIARQTFRQDRLFLYNETEMAELRFSYWSKEKKTVAAMEILQSRADTIILETQQRLAPLAVTDEFDTLTRPDDGRDPAMVLRDKEDNADYLSALSQNVTTLTLANYYLGNDKYSRWAANLVRVYFLNEYAVEDQDEYSSARLLPDNTHLLDFLSDQGYSFPSLSRVPRVVPKYSNRRILSTPDLTKTDITALLDAIRLLRCMQVLTHKEYVELQSIMAEVLEYLVTSPTGIHLAQMTDHRGVLYDLQVTALAAFTDDVRLFLRVANRCRMRIGKQFLGDGTQPHQDASIQARFQSQGLASSTDWKVVLQYETLHLHYWTMLARGIQNSGIAKDIWHYTAKNRGRISHAVKTHLEKHAKQLPSLNQDDAMYVKIQLAPLAHMARSAFAHSNIDPTRHDILLDQRWILDNAPQFEGIDWINDDNVIFLVT